MPEMSESDLLEMCTNAMYDFYVSSNEIMKRDILSHKEIEILWDLIYQVWKEDIGDENGEVL